jgi:hypothetical protein
MQSALKQTTEESGMNDAKGLLVIKSYFTISFMLTDCYFQLLESLINLLNLKYFQRRYLNSIFYKLQNLIYFNAGHV